MKGSCLDVNECQSKIHKCNTLYGVCTNTFGSYTCKCKNGYIGDGVACSDIDECIIKDDRCDKETTICINTNPLYECKCLKGFMKLHESDMTCVDIQECTTAVMNHRHDCDVNASCKNTIGGFACKCNMTCTNAG